MSIFAVKLANVAAKMAIFLEKSDFYLIFKSIELTMSGNFFGDTSFVDMSTIFVEFNNDTRWRIHHNFGDKSFSFVFSWWFSVTDQG